ncbi:MAG: hypothetical protein AAGB51_09690 [Planctomycetota bacterium]
MHTKTIIASTAAALAFAATAHGQAFVNGSMTGPMATSTAPAGWTSWSGTVDTADATGPFNYTGLPWMPSPDGGTFVRAGAGTTSEGLSQVVSGFTVGVAYQIDFFQTNLGFVNPSGGAWTGDDGHFDLYIDGVAVASSTTISKPVLPDNSIVWTAESLTFVATSTTHDIGFLAVRVPTGSLAAYMGIDGVRVSQVPAPGVLATLGGLALTTRRRRAAI